MEKCIRYLEKMWGDQRPFVKLFQTEFGNYMYDPGTNKILKCNDMSRAVLERFQSNTIATAIAELSCEFDAVALKEGLQEIIEAIDKEKVLLTDRSKIYFDSLHFSNLEGELSDNLGQLILEVTEECNLRCVYCVYNDTVNESRNHGIKQMDMAIALKSIDYVAAHSAKNKQPAVTFYGGEPLLRFDFIRQCVDYVHKAFANRKVDFAVTTNATTITPEIAAFLAKEDFGITASIDGPADIHDDYRVFANGKGTHAAAIKGLKTLVDAYGRKAADKINLSMVYTPPFSSGRLDRITSLWNDYPWLKSINGGITYPHDGSIPREKISAEADLDEDKSLPAWAMDIYFEDYAQKKEINPLVRSLVDRLMIKVFRRPVFQVPTHSIHLNGCCVPGGRKIFVTTEGFISVCERVHNAPPYLGHIDTGIDFDLLKKAFVTEYAEKSLSKCSSCWAQRFCGLCYADTYSNQELDDERKSFVCNGTMRTAEEQLKLYTRLLHVDPEGLNYLADIVVS